MSFWKNVAKKLLGNPRPVSPRLRPRLFLERLPDRIAPAVLTINTTADNNARDNFLSLREAVLVIEGQLAVNALSPQEQAQISGAVGPGGNTIAFNIGNQAETISLTSALPTLDAAPVFISGAPPAGNPNQTIAIDGTKVTGPCFDLELNAKAHTTTSGSTIQGLTIQNFQGDAIDIESDHNTIGGLGAGQWNTLTGNQNGIQIDGVDPQTPTAFSNTVVGNTITGSVSVNGDTGFGVRIVDRANNNWIGATATTDPKTHVITQPANVISGNAAANVVIGSSFDNTVIGNFIGLGSDGKTALQNKAQGVAIVGWSYFNQIGGPAPGAMNVISGNPTGGIVVSGAKAAGNTIGGNIIGAASDGTNQNVPNGVGGIIFDNGSAGNFVRQTQIKWNNNVPAINKKDSRSGQELKEFIYDPNSISGNGWGIVNALSAGTPVLTSAVISGSYLEVSGTLASTPNTAILLEFFGNQTTDLVGHEQGDLYDGNFTVQTDANGNATFQATLSTFYGVNVTATATDTSPTGDTSQFSNEAPILVPVQVFSFPGAVTTLKGTVWNDLNSNGFQDSGEAALAGVLVNLFDSSGHLVATTTTDANGAYQFGNVASGQFYVQFVPPPNPDPTQVYLPTAQLVLSMDMGGGFTESAALWTGRIDPTPWDYSPFYP